MLNKPHIVLCNKIDIEGAGEKAEKIAAEIKKTEPETKVIPVSVAAHIGMNDVRIAILELVTKMAGEGAFTSTGERISDGSFLSSKKKGTSLNPNFLASRSVDEFMEEQYPGQNPSESDS